MKVALALEGLMQVVSYCVYVCVSQWLSPPPLPGYVRGVVITDPGGGGGGGGGGRALRYTTKYGGGLKIPLQYTKYTRL